MDTISVLAKAAEFAQRKADRGPPRQLEAPTFTGVRCMGRSNRLVSSSKAQLVVDPPAPTRQRITTLDQTTRFEG